MNASPLVDYLRTYGPSASSDSLYDEHVLKSANLHRVDPIEVGSSLVTELADNFRSTEPRNVILTGTAGDGKTWHCRKIFTALGGTRETWDAGQGLVELGLPGERTLVVVKDLSEFHDDPRQEEILKGFLESLMGRSTNTFYLVAANDGQLLRFWRTYSQIHPEARSVEATIRTMLKENKPTDGFLRLLMHNLSQKPHGALFDSIVTEVMNHRGWSGCEGCGLNDDGRCPIRRNLNVLSGTEMRNRLRDMIDLAAANDTHLPMRHILLLVVNIVLGVSGRKSVLLDCTSARSLVTEGNEVMSNPYDNALGLNLRRGENRDYLAFSVFENAGIGQETNNTIDTLLIEALPKEYHDRYVANDLLHGASLFEEQRARYRRGDAEDFSEFQTALETQRRRLFFVLPVTERNDELDPWRLSVFMHGGSYLRFSDDLRAGRSPDMLKSKLVVGLNRSYSGTMTDDGTSVWFTAPAGNTQSRVGRVLDIELPLGGTPRDIVAFDFDAKGSFDRPRMVVTGREGIRGPAKPIESNPLQPLLFEYLMRVESGSLPGSFSRQCYEELRQFRLRVVARLSRLELIALDDLKEMRIVRLDNDGHLRDESIGVTEQA
ncbi:hypothetical protein BB934_45265 (plasmid) [Microvirga ossetica]|uniref:Uncharacterized protein n=1 Tax=Microvirga ossetica TaxID=1882682 RepID=A0A1B2EZS3_9HYPH|nr:hypothetical protein [Microvirga ossetica]ANY85432.1 hypothetical protein BB934_45265 [Microvirga ossetica]